MLAELFGLVPVDGATGVQCFSRVDTGAACGVVGAEHGVAVFLRKLVSGFRGVVGLASKVSGFGRCFAGVTEVANVFDDVGMTGTFLGFGLLAGLNLQNFLCLYMSATSLLQ